MDTLKSALEAFPSRFPDLRELRYFEQTDSTNRQARQLGQAGVPAPCLVVANGQSAGRGRLGRHWESPAGQGLYFSLLLQPQLPAEQAPLLTLAAGLAIKHALEGFGVKDLLVKWPNDVIIQGKKVGGVLSEMETRGSEMLFVILGIGLNISQKKSDFPQELQETAASLDQLHPGVWHRDKVLEKILGELFQEIKNLEAEKVDQLIKRWEQESGFLGKKIKVEKSGQQLQGKVHGLDMEGHLLLETAPGKIVTLIAEDTTLI